MIKDFLLSKGVNENELVFKSIEIDKKYKTKNRFNNDGDKVASEEYLMNMYLNKL